MALMLRMAQATLLTLLTLSYGAADTKTETCNNGVSPATKVINSFSLKLEQMIENQDNYFFSPLSISVALAMVYIGARGTTRQQMADTLGYDIFGRNCLSSKISESLGGLIQSMINEGDDYQFLVANGAFIQTGLDVSHFYSNSLERYFKSKMQFVNFQREEIAAMNTINDWVANYTKGKVAKLLPEPLNPLTLIILVNAIYFKGLWYLPFDEEATENRTFYGLDNSEKSVPFMELKHVIHNYYDAEKQYSIIELEYMSGNISMIILLPKDVNEFPRYELTSETLCNLRGKFQSTAVSVLLPKFSFEFKRELSKDMMNMGMPDLFSDRANLSGISEGNELHVSLVVHKAVIEVNEKGSEASAVSGFEIIGRNRVAKFEYFVANHPFLFYIVHKDTNTILFSGRVVNP